MKKFNFRVWEIALILISLLFFVASLILYVSNIPIRGYLLGIHEDETQTQVGSLGQSAGEVKRQLMTDSEFTRIGTSAPLYNQDTIVTGPDSGAQLSLEDGSTIDLGPNTMVTLAFESRLSLGGISRGATVNVVTGTVTGVAKTAPIKIRSRREVVTLATNVRQTVKAPPIPMVAPPLPPPIPTPAPLPIAAPSPSPSPSPLAPMPSPSPSLAPPPPRVKVTASVEWISPRLQERVSVDRGSPKPEKRVDLEWRILEAATVPPRLAKGKNASPPKARLTLSLVRRSSSARGGVAREQIAQQVVALQAGRGKYGVVLRKPGLYEWHLHDEQGGPLPVKPESTVGQFTLLPTYEAIEVLDPLVGGQAGASNALKGQLLKNFDVTLRWKAYEGMNGRYRIQFAGTPDFKKVLMLKEVAETAYRFNKDKIFTGQIFYRVLASHPAGFTVTSPPEKFAFNFLPPMLVVPEDKTVLSSEALKRDDDTILFTWQKTNFTEKYEFQIGLDVEFKTVYIKLVVKENFFVLKAPKPGKYWWRVKSMSKATASSFSRSHSLEINP